MKLEEAVSRRLSKLMEERGLTQYKLSRLGGVPKSTISTIINATYKPRLETMYQIVATLGISLKDFFDDPLFDNIDG